MTYRLRVSPWARGLSLRVTAQGALEVVAPRRVGPRTIARVLAQEQAWIQTARGVRVLPAGAGRLVLAGQVGDTLACRQALRRWLVRAGQTHLVPRLADLSGTLGLSYARTTIRLARSRWGSCSRTGSIALNARLLLLAPPLVDYVLVHELCHTRELNHSPAFWALVAQHCPEYRRHRIALRAAGKQMPAWARDAGEVPA